MLSAPPEVETPKNYAFRVDGRSAGELWQRARHHLILTFNDRDQELELEERRAQNVLAGRGTVPWPATRGDCYSHFDLHFETATDEARLQLTILRGIPASSRCENWELPSLSGYKAIQIAFDDIADGLGKALRAEADPETGF